jgi:NAD+ synthase
MGTGNKDEDEIGYMTKFGDSAVDLCPMSDLHKSVVWELGKFLGVPESIINAKPTAGLWDGQTDEDELGMTYAEVEWAIEQDELVENKAAFDEDGNWIMVQRWMLEEDHTPRQKEVLSKVRDMRRKNAHKLHYPPVFKVEMNKYE